MTVTDNINEQNNEYIETPLYEELLKAHFLLSMEKLMMVGAAEIPADWIALAEAISLEGNSSVEKSKRLFECIVTIANAAFNTLSDLQNNDQASEEEVNE